MQLNAETLKKFAMEQAGVDKVGIANIERFKDAPPDMSPFEIMPRARSAICFIKRIPRGCYRGIDEGTHFPSYTVFGYAGLNRELAKAGYRISCFLEDHGYEGVQVAAGATTREVGPRSPSPGQGRPKGDVTLQFRIAATLAGVGEIGWSKVFMTKEFGPRQRIGIVLTDAELAPDPIRTGELCDRCKRCVSECPGGAIARERVVSIEADGHKIEWNDLDLGKCKLTHFGLNRKNSPYMAKRFPGVYLPIPEQQVTWLEAWDMGWLMFPAFPTYKALARSPIAFCGARGCIIGCMKNVERKGIVKNTFNAQPGFSCGKPWSMPEKPPIAQHNGFIYDPVNDPDLQQDDKQQEDVLPEDAESWY